MVLKFRDWPLVTKLLLPSVLIVGVFAASAYWSYSVISEKQQLRSEQIEALSQRGYVFSRIRASITEADSILFRYLLSLSDETEGQSTRWTDRDVVIRLNEIDELTREQFDAQFIANTEIPYIEEARMTARHYSKAARRVLSSLAEDPDAGRKAFEVLSAQFMAVETSISAWENYEELARKNLRSLTAQEEQETLQLFLLVAFVVVGLAFLMTYLAARSISRPIQSVVDIMRELADGGQCRTVPATDRKDEVGMMMSAIAVFRDRLEAYSEQARKHQQEEEEIQAALQAKVEKLAASEQRLLDIAESASDWFWETDKDDRLTMVSQRFYDVTGRTPDQVIGMTRLEYSLPARDQEEASRWVAYARQCAQHLPFRNLDYRVRTGGGDEIHVRSSGRPYFDADGEFLGYRGASSNVSALIKAREELVASRNYLLGLTSNLFEGVLLVALDGEILFANPSAHRLLEVPEGTLKGQHIDSVMQVIVKGVDTRFIKGPVHRALAVRDTLVDENGQFRLLPSGKKISVAYACAATSEEMGAPSVVASFRSIEALKHAQQEALQASRLASVGQLAAGIAHEINTPIQYIGDNIRFFDKSFAALKEMLTSINEVVSKDGVPPDVQQSVADAVEDADADYLMEELPDAARQSLDGVEHVTKIVRSMKEFSHPGGGASKVVTDINRAIESTLTVATNEWKHNAVIEKDLDPDLPHILCLPAEINQVLLNILVNAAHALEGRPEKGTIRISTRRAGEEIEIRIADNGPGVPQEIREHIFDPFFTTKAVGKGTGQGLAISMDVVVNKHSGRLVVDDAPGGGAVFVIRLPITAETSQGEHA